jgi:hypothetical protein
MKLNIGLLSLAGTLALSAGAKAQSINIDVDNFFGTPTSALAAAGVAGTWNDVPATTTGTALVNVAGGATSAMIAYGGGSGAAYNTNNPATSGNDQAMLDDIHDPVLGASVWTISGLQAGTYTVYTYGMAPDDTTYRTGISVNGGPLTSVGGLFTGTYVVPTTHAVDTVVVPAAGNITITLTVVTGFASFAGVQIKLNGTPPPAFTGFCFGDGTGAACPCGINGATGNGCANSLNANGANIGATGVASIANDTLVLNGSGMPNSSALYFQGSAQQGGGNGSAFGDGKRCAGGQITRLGTKTNVSGSSSYPVGADLLIHVKGNVVAGNTRQYQVWYRNADPVFCTPSTFNLSNGGEVTWAP